MDEKYFNKRMWDMFDLAHMGFNVPWFETEKALEILKQIAHDAKVEQARVDRDAVEKLERQATMYIPWRSETVECLAVVKTALAAVAPEDK